MSGSEPLIVGGAIVLIAAIVGFGIWRNRRAAALEENMEEAIDENLADASKDAAARRRRAKRP